MLRSLSSLEPLVWAACLLAPPALVLRGAEINSLVDVPVGAVAVALATLTSLGLTLHARHGYHRVVEVLQRLDRDMPDMLFKTDGHGRILRVTQACERLLGYPVERMTGRLLYEFVVGPLPYLDDGDRARPHRQWQAQWRHADGRDVRLISSVVPSFDGRGNCTGIRGLARDASSQLRAEEALRASEERFRRALNASQNGIMLVTHDGQLLLGNTALADLTGYAAAQLEGLRLADLVPPTHLDQLMALIASRLWSDAAPGEYELQLRASDGALVDVELTISALRESGRESGVLIEVRDLTESRRTFEAIRRMTEYDRLTGLPNRELFDRHVERALIDARADGRSVALLLLDLDRFKLVNDTLGHLSGDRLLKAVAERLTAGVGPQQLVARFSGDEFLVLAPNLPSVSAAEAIAQRALDAFREPFEHDDHQLQIAASAGVAVFPQHADDTETLIRIADSAVHFAKADGGSCYRLGSADAAEPARLRLALEGDLRRAVERKEFEVYYQPQIDPATMRIQGVEALLRWRHPQRGVVGPGEFIPLLEETGLIVEVGEWVLRTACMQVQQWRASGGGDVRLAVNLSPRQLLVPNIARCVQDVLRETGLPPSALELELTETSAALGLESVLEELTASGVATAIDDFGIGQSWLGRLKRFPVHTLKIDRSFVTGMHESPDDFAIVQAIVALGHALGLSVVAEGVETHRELEMLRSVGCDLVQGFYFSPAIEAGEMQQMLEDFAVTDHVAA